MCYQVDGLLMYLSAQPESYKAKKRTQNVPQGVKFSAVHIANPLFLCGRDFPTTVGLYSPLLYPTKEILN